MCPAAGRLESAFGTTHACSINEKGLYDYLLINDDLEEAVKRLKAIADRAVKALDPEPGMVPERVVLEDVRVYAWP